MKDQSMLMNTIWAHADMQLECEAAGSRILVSHGEETWFTVVPGETMRIRVPGAAVAGQYSIVESLALPMSGPPMHTHREEEIFYVLDGVLTFEVAGEYFNALPGMLVVVPKGVPHAWRNFGDKPARSLVVFTPGGIDTLFPRLANLSLPQMAELAAQYDVTVVGPPIERDETRSASLSIGT
jgi:quercetin dioxygenase-like cupin family protein